MGKPTGFMDYDRKVSKELRPTDRIKNFGEFHLPLPAEEQALQGARCMDCGVPFCQYGEMINGMASGCPLHNLCPEWNDLVYRGNLKEAYLRLSKTNNFPEFTSRVCPALCENACTCGLSGDPVSTKEDERLIIETAFEHGYVDDSEPAVRTDKRVAVIGSGPSGLACATQLNKRGHHVTVYERSDMPGGLLMYGIPNMKLDKKVVERRIELMKKTGIEFITSTEVGGSAKKTPQKAAKGDRMNDCLKDDNLQYVKVEKLLQEYDAVVLACGAAAPRNITAPGRDAKGIYYAVDFLKTTTSSLVKSNFKDGNYVSAKGKKVLIIGGGDTGNDCVGTSIRQGCTAVTQLEMMPCPPEKRAASNPWPEWPRVLKTDYGQQEAIAVFGSDPRIYETTVKEFIKDAKGNVKAAKCVYLDWKKDPETGRMNMSERKGSEFVIECDIVLIAAGFVGAEEHIAEAFGVARGPRGNVATQPGAYATGKNKIYTCGDMHRGQSLVVWAIHEGRECAREVDRDLIGYTNLK